jgi:hypothetical protein
MIKKLILLLNLATFVLAVEAQDTDIRPYRTGDKIVSEVIMLGVRGREIFNETTTLNEFEITSTPDSYSLKSASGTNTFARKGHFLLEQENERGKRVIPDSQRLKWMPPNGDLSKPYLVSSEFVAAQNCGGGIGKTTYEAIAKPSKFKIKIKGVEQELDVITVDLDGKWQAGSCGSGKASTKIVYSSQLDQVLENDNRNFQPNGFLNFGRISRTVSIN